MKTQNTIWKIKYDVRVKSIWCDESKTVVGGEDGLKVAIAVLKQARKDPEATNVRLTGVELVSEIDEL